MESCSCSSGSSGNDFEQPRVQALYVVSFHLARLAHAGASGARARQSRVQRDAALQRSASNGVGVTHRGALILHGIEYELDIAVLDHVDDMGTPIGHLVDRRDAEACAS